MAFKLPKNLFPHSVTYIKKATVGGWKPEPEERTEVTGVKISTSDGLMQTNQEIKSSARAVMFVSPDWSNYTDFEAGQFVEYNGERYAIGQIHTYSQPTSNLPYHWKVELI